MHFRIYSLVISSERNLAKYVSIKDNWQDFSENTAKQQEQLGPLKSLPLCQAVSGKRYLGKTIIPSI